jgi:hypothetical protein
MDVQTFRHQQLCDLTDSVGVYALCDLDEVPIYVGQSVDSIRARVRRHLTSARSDIIANRQIDVWEVAFVWAWPLIDTNQIADVEAELFWRFDPQSRLMNGTVPMRPKKRVCVPDRLQLQVLPDDEINLRKEPRQRFPRQMRQIESLLDYILQTYDKPHLRRSLHAHVERLDRYYANFQGDFIKEFQRGR